MAEEKIVLACEVPETAAPGSTFHVQLEDRFFEVLTPEGTVPGQTIHIVVPGEASGGSPEKNEEVESVFDQLQTLSVQALEHARNLNETFKISEKLAVIATPAVDKLRSIDEQYGVSKTTIAVGAQAQTKLLELDEKYKIVEKTQSIIASGVDKVREIEESQGILARAQDAGAFILAYAREIDVKYAVSVTAARLVREGASAIINFDKQHQVSSRTAALLASAADVLTDKLQKLGAVSAIAEGPATEQNIQLVTPSTTVGAN